MDNFRRGIFRTGEPNIGRVRFHTRRDKRGSAMADFAPVLLIFFVAVLFPLINLLALPIYYSIASYYVHLEVRELAASRISSILVPPPSDLSAGGDFVSDGGFVHQHIRGKFIKTGLSLLLFHGDTSPPINSVVKLHLSQNSSDVPSVTDTVTMTIAPLVRCPMFKGVPGLDAPMVVSITEARTKEEVR